MPETEPAVQRRRPDLVTRDVVQILEPNGRTPNERMTFGWGVHSCLGAHLARAEVKAFWEETLRRKYRFVWR
jgi:cytochrome P450